MRTVEGDAKGTAPGGADQERRPGAKRVGPGPLSTGAVYFGLVFAVGFVFGTIRVLFVVPVLGESAAEILETPLMLGASFLAARWVVRRFRVPSGARHRLPVGLLALALLLLAELVVVLELRGISLAQYLASRDPLAGVVYLVSLAIFALMPWLVLRALDSGPGPPPSPPSPPR